MTSGSLCRIAGIILVLVTLLSASCAGALSMANSGPNTNGCQFFITYTPQHHLDGKHSVFGQMVEGMDVLEKITQGDAIIRITTKER